MLPRGGHRRGIARALRPQASRHGVTVCAGGGVSDGVRVDARGVKAFRLSELRDLHYAFDHDSIIAAYLRWREKHATQPRGSGHSTEPWVHTACV